MKIATRITLAVLIVAGLALAGTYLTLTGAFVSAAAAPEVGVQFPDFKLKDYAGNEHSLEMYRGKIVVLDFCSQQCPYSRGVDPDLAELARVYQPKGVIFLGIDSHKDTTADQIKQYAGENKIPQPILKDEGNRVADAAGAKVTPEFYVIDKNGALAYHGAFDNRAAPTDRGSIAYVKNALDALLEGKEIAVKQAKTWGCSIKRAQ